MNGAVNPIDGGINSDVATSPLAATSTGAAGADRPRRASAPPTRLRFLIMAAKMSLDFCLEPTSCSALARRVPRAGRESLS